MAYKAVIFDCFGVLMISGSKLFIQHHPEHREAILDLIHKSDLCLITKQDFTEAVAKIVNVPIERAANVFYNKMQQNASAVEWARDLKQQGYKLGFLSNIGRGWIEQFVASQVIFDEIILSCNVGMIKPNPAIFKLMADRLGLKPEECIMIDDSRENIVGAEQAGMSGVLFVDTQQAKLDFEKLVKA